MTFVRSKGRPPSPSKNRHALWIMSCVVVMMLTLRRCVDVCVIEATVKVTFRSARDWEGMSFVKLVMVSSPGRWSEYVMFKLI